MVNKDLNGQGRSSPSEDTEMPPSSKSGSLRPATMDTISCFPEHGELENLCSRLHIGDERPHTVREPRRDEDFLNESFCVGEYDAPLETDSPLAYYKRTLEFPQRRYSTDSKSSEATTIKCASDSETILEDKIKPTQPSSRSKTGEETRTPSFLSTPLGIRKAPRISKRKAYSSKRERWWKVLAKVRSQDSLKL